MVHDVVGWQRGGRFMMKISLKPASSKSETRSSRLESPSRSEGGHQRSETTDDLRRVVSSWIDRGEAIPLNLKEEMDKIKSFAYTDFHFHSDLRSRALGVARCMKSLSNDLEALAAKVREESAALENIPRVCGFASLPDDVLAMIFDLVVNNYENWKYWYCGSRSWKSAVSLSHVSKHFRDVTLAHPRLWTKLSRSGKMAVSCLPRTKNAPLTIGIKFLLTESDEWAFQSILSKVLPYSNRWHSLGIYLDSVKKWEPENEESDEGQEIYGLSAASLKEMSIQSGFYDFTDSWPDWDWSRWYTPNLRSLTAFRYFPSSLPGLSYVTYLRLTFLIDDESLPKIMKEVAKMVSLKTLFLTLETADGDENPTLHEKMVFSNVTNLSISLEEHLPVDLSTPALTRALFSSMYFPLATELRVTFTGNAYIFDSDYDEKEHFNFYCNKAISRIFRHVDQFPLVKELYLGIKTEFEVSGAYAELSVPLLMLPSLKSLTLESDGRTIIKEPEHIDETEFDNGLIAMPPRVFGKTLPLLATVSLDILDESVALWLGDYLKSLKESEGGGWNDFRELAVWEADDDLDDGNLYQSTFSRDEALDWCENMING
ncbi:hypothetical protein SCHPADRAFT_886429 [Schizopora paradoxa]|uniref:Uncharacterized protein n=1 Tax=Schizopora paradoxa TaxID=27342 RepID=A0A0H2S908_9AGAM|nr:hypothetical protein SCHPADRAFT_886429 [Schizopora paradoxa]